MRLPEKKPARQSTGGTEVFLGKDVFSSLRLSSLAARMKITPTQQAAYTKALIEEGGGDVSKVAISYATAD